ncbi:MAG: M81 family metallopeptidase [Kofleriaceae bacterium]
MKRLAFARIAQETNALSPVPTQIADFATTHLHAGNEVLAMASRRPEVPGMFRRAELTGFVSALRARARDVEPVPLLSAWAPPGGPLSPACFAELEHRLLDGLDRAGRVDGMYLCLHGAMGAQGLRDPEGRLVRAVRERLRGAPLVVSHDLHANVTRARVEAADAIVAYQTNPHRDLAATGAKAGRILAGTVLGELRPEMAWRTLPMMLGGGTTVDFLSPMRAVFRRLRAAERSGALAASVLMVHPWNDDPALGWSTIAVTNGDRAGAERIAEELAELCWERRHHAPPTPLPPADAIDRARRARIRRRLGCVMMSDASDVVAAGAPGDSTHLLAALIEHAPDLRSYAAVRDPVAIAELWMRSEGEVVTTAIGGRLDPARSTPLAITATIRTKRERHGFGRCIVLAVGDTRIVLTEGPALVIKPSFYTELGLPIWRADIVVVKSLFLARLFFLPYSRLSLLVRTHGATDFDAGFALTLDGPIHPRDDVADWRERDRLRRCG